VCVFVSVFSHMSCIINPCKNVSLDGWLKLLTCYHVSHSEFCIGASTHKIDSVDGGKVKAGHRLTCE